ncbi:MAG: multiheme c-type cytochrome [Burkholderiales bacterium]
MRQQRLHGLFLVLGLVILGLAGCDAPRESVSRSSDSNESFLQKHWGQPLQAQGIPPAHFSPLEASLDPRACGTCHVAQFNDWKQSRHSLAMGPGIMGQLLNMSPIATEEHQDCIRCHAPLKEQADSLVAALTRGPGKSLRPPGETGPALHEQGLVCAACHIRGHQRYGPPREDGSKPEPGTPLPHNGWISEAAFGDSRFCAACHQFTNDGYALNGKLLENTYEEWKASRYAREGMTCQSCHMPDRRHQWRGIHDAETVKSGITIKRTAARVESGTVTAALSIRNTGTGHFFPTYVTPKVVAQAYQEDARGKALPGTLQEYVIGRQVSPDLSTEIADTRIAPDQQALLNYRASLHRNAVALAFRVRVEPDAFYTGFYRDLLKGKQAGNGERLIKQALKESMASAFTLHFHREPLPASVHRTSSP